MIEKKIQEDLAVVKKIMLESRQRFYNVGIHLVVCGGIVILSLLLTYYSVFIKYLLPEYWIWLIGFTVALIFEYLQSKRYHKFTNLRNKINRIGGALWMSILITLMMFVIIGGISGQLTNGPSAFIAGLLAIGYFVTGEAIEMKWIKYLGIGWWIGAIILFFSYNDIDILIMALLMICLQFIPGIILVVKGPKND